MPLQVLHFAIVATLNALGARTATNRRLGLGVASTAAATALDAGSRLDTLSTIALNRGAEPGAA
ncbi:MAG: hypothetical protein A2V85_09640 [Chloroflexi bacterium RBG_16_72_14]|nr:MAG: hypothetical protein A2V85_09640 [Chloroflexi bacterium RBG_16_72_14]